MPGPTCTLCQSQDIRKSKVFRLGSAGQILGLLFLIPGLLMLLGGIGGCVLTVDSSSKASVQMSEQREAERNAITQSLEDLGISDGLIDKAREPGALSAEDPALEGLEPEQLTAVLQADSDYYMADSSEAGQNLGAGMAVLFGGGMSLAIAVIGLVLMCIGALFRLRKAILKCHDCGAVLANA